MIKDKKLRLNNQSSNAQKTIAVRHTKINCLAEVRIGALCRPVSLSDYQIQFLLCIILSLIIY